MNRLSGSDLLKQIPTIVKDIVSSHGLTTFDRAHLSGPGSSSINYEVLYTVDPAEYAKYMDTHQLVPLKIMVAFHARGIEFAYPTQRLYIDKPQEETEQVGKTVDIN
jgi:small-conductance mechanosensitive channel